MMMMMSTWICMECFEHFINAMRSRDWKVFDAASFLRFQLEVLLIAQVALAQESATLESMTFHPSHAHQHVHTQYICICISPLLARSESDYLISTYTAGRGLDSKSSFSLITPRPLRGLIETTTLGGCVIKINCKYTLCSSSYTKLLHHDHWSPDHSATLSFLISNLLINIAVLARASYATMLEPAQRQQHNSDGSDVDVD